jgi:type I site-specific restriction endonuclease
LNLPEFEYKLKKEQGKVYIFDIIRRKHVVLTPEEWVRQALLHYFTAHQKYPKSLIKVENGLRYNQLQRRSDIIVFDRSASPFLVVECKTFQYQLTESALTQVSVYNKSIKAPFIAISNGLKHYCMSLSEGISSPMESFPEYPS